MIPTKTFQLLLVLFSYVLFANAKAVSLGYRQAASLSVATDLPTNWTHVGCYEDQVGNRTLKGADYGDGSGMNASACIKFCNSKNFVYAGTEYSSGETALCKPDTRKATGLTCAECYCDNILSNATTLESDSSCDMACTGNSSEVCGGPALLTVYYANKPVPQGLHMNAGPAGWTSQGCWADGSTKALAHEVTSQVPGGGDNMMVEVCTSACGAAGYKLAGIEYASECYCDDYVSQSASNVTLQQCNMPCNGNSSEFCGAGYRMNIYANGTNAATTKPKTLTPPPPGGWFDIGCYNDSSNARTLNVTQYLQVSMTIEACTSACASNNYTFAGVEYAGECYCGNNLNQYAVIQTDGRCDMACNGNQNQVCGGPNGLSVYQLTGWFDVGCWKDTVGDRTLGKQQYGLGDLTAAKCTTACFKNGFTYAGLEYGNECYCDNAPQNYGGPATDGSVGCNMPCQGDNTELCGGPGRLNVYQYNNSAVPVTSTQPGGSDPTNPNTPTSPTPSSSVNASAILPFTYQGCYTDDTAAGRALTNQQPDNNTLTVESCIVMCTQGGYAIAGMEYGVQCFCDQYLHNAPKLVGDGDCNMNCGGSSGEKCGAGGRLSIYSNGTMGNFTNPTTQQGGIPGNWTYQGCWSDIDGARTLEYKMVFPTNNSNVNCLSLCAKYGYNAGGTEFGQECYCGDVSGVQASGATKQPESDCNSLCTDDNGKSGGHICGGPSRLSYYTWTGPPLYNWTVASGNAAGKYEFFVSGPVIPLITAPSRNGKVTFLEKFGTSPANNGTGAYELDYSLVGQANASYSDIWREMHVKTDIFCSAGLTLPDRAGRQIDVGGWAGDSTFGVRLYWPDGKPGTHGQNDWQENQFEVSLVNGRWYPSAMIMANGSILVMGGEEGSNGAAVPTLEVLPSPSGEALYCDYLQRTDPNNLYPFLVVLPSGGILVAYYNEARILDPVSLQTQRTLPNIPGAVYNNDGGRTYPFQGTAMVLPQVAPYSDPLELLICGGSVPFTEIALDNCVTIAPDVPNANWTIERMPSKRLMPNMVALPDGTYLILNGARQGRAGFGLATDPNLGAVLYDPSQPIGSRMTIMASTTIARLYHSEAILLDDARVLVSGSDPEDVCAFAPQEYRTEIFSPPYILNDGARPGFNISNLDWSYGQQVSFALSAPGSGGGYRVSLMGAVASTHGNSMGQRTYFPAVSCSSMSCTVTAPPNANVMPPGWFQMFLLDGSNVPSHATWVRIGGDPASLGNWPNYSDFQPLPGTGPVQALF